MFVVKPNFHKNNPVRIKPEGKFRNTDYRFGKRMESVIFKDGLLNNPTYQYELVTVPLVGGTYQFRINSVDNLNNINDGVSASYTLSDILWYPTDLHISDVTNNDVTLNWTLPTGGVPSDNIIVYGNGGSGYNIDRTTPLAILASNITEVTLTGLADGIWYFVVESKNSSSETVNYFTAIKTLPIEDESPAGPNDPDDPSNDPFDSRYLVQNIQLMNVSVGRCGIEFLWYYDNKASHFRVYHDSGTGTVDWSDYKFRFERINDIVQKFTTDQIVTEEGDVVYKFGIRAESPHGVVEENTIEYEVLLDGKAPEEATNIIIGGV